MEYWFDIKYYLYITSLFEKPRVGDVILEKMINHENEKYSLFISILSYNIPNKFLSIHFASLKKSGKLHDKSSLSVCTLHAIYSIRSNSFNVRRILGR